MGQVMFPCSPEGGEYTLVSLESSKSFNTFNGPLLNVVFSNQLTNTTTEQC
jgi:hypothetical protein